MPSLIEHIASQPLMRVIGALLTSTRPRHLRELAKEQGISVAGVADIIRRLEESGLILEERVGNKRRLSLNVEAREKECLCALFRELENLKLEKRAVTFGARAEEKLQWMDDAYAFYRRVKNGENSSRGA